ncbi:MAG TPA: anhydro-N-acetylmuramic acid kinase [Bryobacteraceae bacterium]|nr:anhydro-N-acetylmuramic acid kinase [Bryobacteraceae bacterium]
MRVAGLISGTSLDGIDIAVVEVGQAFSLSILTFQTIPYPPEVRTALLAISNTNTHTAQISRLNFLVGELFAEAVLSCGIPPESIELIGSHGQTIFHEAEPVDVCGRKIASTMQIGEPAIIAERTRIPVVADFRPSDMAAGGKGAPLVPYVDYLLFRSDKIGRVALNIGGISNISVIPAAACPDQVVAFDTGPGNMVIDGLTGSFDRDGALGRSGRIDPKLLDRLLQDPYYRRKPPKTAGREQYGRELLATLPTLPLEDLVATATELTAQTIAQAVNAYPGIAEVIASGGGVHNPYLMERLRTALHPELKTSADYGIDPDAKEAIAFAILAYETWHGRPSNLPSATGAYRPAILGKIVRPSI